MKEEAYMERHLSLVFVSCLFKKKSISKPLVGHILSYVTPNTNLIKKAIKEADKHFDKLEQFPATLELIEESTQKLAKGDPKLTELDLSNRELNRLDETRWKSFCEALASNKTLEKLTLNGTTLPCWNEDKWKLFCDAIGAQNSVETLNLEQCVTSIVASHPSQTKPWHEDCKKTIKCWGQFYFAFSENRSITELNLAHNMGLGLEESRFGRAIFRNNALRILNLSFDGLDGKEQEDVYINIRACSKNLHKIVDKSNDKNIKSTHSLVNSIFAKTNKIISIKERYPRHRAAIAFGQGLYSKQLPRHVAKHILTFFEVTRLADQALKELDKHLSKPGLIDVDDPVSNESRFHCVIL